MQGSGKDNRFTQGQQRETMDGARVIDLRSWKNKRRVESMKQRYWNARMRLRFAGLLLALAAAVLAVFGCFPTAFQNHLILLCWFVGLVGMCYALFLHVRYDAIAKRLMLANLCSLALSFGAALAKLLH